MPSRRSCTCTTRRASCSATWCSAPAREGIVDIAVQGAKWCKAAEPIAAGTDFFYEYSPESYTGTELEFAVEVCNGVMEVFVPTPATR